MSMYLYGMTPEEAHDNYIEEKAYKRGYEDAKKELDRPHGKWIADDWVRDAFGEFYHQYVCSECGYKVIKLHPFCVCGADMREGEAE